MSEMWAFAEESEPFYQSSGNLHAILESTPKLRCHTERAFAVKNTRHRLVERKSGLGLSVLKV